MAKKNRKKMVVWVQPTGAPAETPALTFTCPKCKDHRLECVMEGIHVCGVERIDPEGNFEYGAIISYADVNRWQCLICGFTLQTEKGDTIIDNEDVVAWIKDNCTQKR